MQSTIVDKLYGRDSAADFISQGPITYKPSTLAYWACKEPERLKVTKIGRRAFYKESELKRFIEAEYQEKHAP